MEVKIVVVSVLTEDNIYIFFVKNRESKRVNKEKKILQESGNGGENYFGSLK